MDSILELKNRKSRSKQTTKKKNGIDYLEKAD